MGYKKDVNTRVLSISDPQALASALEVLTGGGLVAFPTDTVYGIGAMVLDEMAVSRIYDVKGRGTEKAIPVLAGDMGQIGRIAAGMSQMDVRLAEKFWPGPLTLVLPRHPNIPNAVSSLSTIGVRIPDFSPTQDLLKLTGPLAVTSANLIGQSGASTAAGVLTQLQGKIDLVLDGGVTPGGLPSTVVDCSSGKPVILREGRITKQQLLDALAG